MLAVRRSLPPGLAPEIATFAMLVVGGVVFLLPASLLARSSLRTLWAVGGRLRRQG